MEQGGAKRLQLDPQEVITTNHQTNHMKTKEEEQELELDRIRQLAEAKLAKGREEYRKEQEAAEAKAREERKAIELQAQKRERAKERLYAACEKLCLASLSARFYCPENVQQEIDDAVKNWKEIQQAMN